MTIGKGGAGMRLWRGAGRPLRLAAYAVCVREDEMLLARWVGAEGPRWTLPGGGVDHGEDPYDAAIREVAEETGYQVEIERLLGIHTIVVPVRDGSRDTFHGVRVVYEGRVVGGELRDEVGGSTDMAAWVALDRVAELDHVDLVDVALDLHRTRPADGRSRLVVG
ncbi:NUDIX hydrolase [Thermopolyspora sp. NPDC052614]|uniref:NUDIX hydrolase n=1 Tax=Thermopolyspora sp. NPDC052614 TaxID=3155682 RepID=UPI003429B9E5